MADSFTPRGLNEALSNLKKLSIDIAAVAIPEGARDAANVFKDAVKPRIPRKTGDMAKTLRIVKKKVSGSSLIVGYSVRVGSSKQFQAFLLEFGFHHVGSGEWVQIPFMRPTFEQKAGDAIAAFVARLKKAVDNAGTGGST